MAGDWLKMEICLPDKPEVLAMSALTGMEPDLIVGKCFRVWRWFDQHTESGNAVGVTLVTLGYAIGNGDSSTKFLNALLSVGWIEESEQGVRLPNFDRHNGETAKTRALTAKRVAKHKSKGNAKSNANTVTSAVTSALPREEKRREEVNTPHTPLAGGFSAVADAKKKTISLQTFLAACKSSGEKPVPEDDPVFSFASSVGIPHEFLQLAWLEFKSRYGDGSKRYKDWRSVFRKAVRGNWFKLWFVGEQGIQLSSQGKLLQNAHREAA